MRTELTFVIDALRPETLSLGRLSAYLAELTKVVADNPGIHFDCVREGSARLCAWVEDPALDAVHRQVEAARSGLAAPDALKSLDRLNELLREDGAVGSLTLGGAEIIPFPGRTLPRVESLGPVKQATSVQGQLVRIGGRDKTVPFLLQDGADTWTGNTNRDLARDMGRHLFGATLRVHGQGSWTRTADGRWTLHNFLATTFEVLDDAPLGEVLGRLRSIGRGQGD